MFLSNPHINLRAVEPEDLDTLYAWENDSHLWSSGNTLSPYSKLALRQYINDALHMDIYQSKQLRLMVEQTERKATIGTIDIYDVDVHNKRAGIGILIDKKYRKQSYASQVLELIENYAFNFLHLHQLYAHISVNNSISIHLFEKAGYKHAGTLKDWIHTSRSMEDVCILQLINNYE